MNQLLKQIKSDNRGASLITVIITVSLLAVLGTMLAGAALVNYQMKRLDQRSKKDFYTAESALDDVYNGLGKNITVIIADSYDTALAMNNSGGGSGSAFASEEAAYAYLKKEFVKQFQSYYTIGVPGNPSDSVNPINSEANRETLRATLESYIVQPSDGTATVENIRDIVVDANYNSLTLKEVVVTYENTQMDMVSSVTTDIVLSVPTLRFFDNHDYLWDYAIIGNQGVYARSKNSGVTDSSTVRGNVFAGIGPFDTTKASLYGQKDVYGGLNLFETTLNLYGETIISAGDVNLRSATLNLEGTSAGKKANLWTGTIQLAANGNNPNVFTAYGNLFLDNDLEINSYNSTVTLSGNYYGYNNRYATKESAASGLDHTKSSSILVNGRNNTLNLRGLDLLLLAGRAYMDFDTADIQSEGGSKEYGTGEGLALRTNQMIYMVPTEFLPYANPERKALVTGDVQNLDETEMRREEWFGSQYLSATQPVRQEVIRVDGEEFVYFFLNFKSDEDRTAYVNTILNASAGSTDTFEQQAYELKRKMEERAGVLLNNDLVINSGSENCSVYSNFAVVEYNSTTGTMQAASRSENNLIQTNIYAPALVSRYAYLCDTLDPKSDVSLDTIIAPYSSTGAAELPLSKFVRINPGDDYLTLITNYGNCALDGISMGTSSYRKNVTGTTYDVLIAKDDLDLNSLNFDGVILTLGNVTLTDCTVNGIVLSAGEVTLKNSTVNANREIIQSIIEAESQEIDALGIAGGDLEHIKYFVHYLNDIRYNGAFAYGKDSIGTDYTQFITYENWKKGDVR